MIDLVAARAAANQVPPGGVINVTRRWLEQALLELEGARNMDAVLDLPSSRSERPNDEG